MVFTPEEEISEHKGNLKNHTHFIRQAVETRVSRNRDEKAFQSRPEVKKIKKIKSPGKIINTKTNIACGYASHQHPPPAFFSLPKSIIV